MVACFLVGLTVVGLADNCPPMKAFEYEMGEFLFVVTDCRQLTSTQALIASALVANSTHTMIICSGAVRETP